MKLPDGSGIRPEETRLSRPTIVAIAVAALGYFVDIYDLILFSVVRIKSLAGLGVQPEHFKTLGASLINWQMFGILLGGFMWGMIGDRRGRISVLFGSIILYSVANIANGFIGDVPAQSSLSFLHLLGLGDAISQYKVLRFIAGVGLAGELGAGITLVSELMGRHGRGYGATLVASFGIGGGLLAVFVSERFEWRAAYLVGGVMGLLLLVLRVGVVESGLFSSVKQSTAARGSLLLLFWPPRTLLRYLAVVTIAVPIWYAVGILITFSPELARALGVVDQISAGTAVVWCYGGLVLGDVSSGLLSQWLRSRRVAVAIFLGLTALAIAGYLVGTQLAPQAWVFYLSCGALGFASGYWAVFMLIAAEQFGTNMRATATTSAPCMVRGSVPILSTAWIALQSNGFGVIAASAIVGGICLALAIGALCFIEESYGRSLDFLEEHK